MSDLKSKSKTHTESTFVAFMKFLLRRLLILAGTLLATALVSMFVFSQCGKSINWKIINYKLSHAHEIDVMDDILAYYFPTLVVLSIIGNVLFIMALNWFLRGIKEGYILVGQGGAIKD